MSLDEVKAFLEKEVRGKLSEIDRNNLIPEQLLRKMASLGFFGLRVPKEYGGREVSMREFLEIPEVMSKECPSLALMLSLHAMACDIIVRFGSEDLKKCYLPEVG